MNDAPPVCFHHKFLHYPNLIMHAPGGVNAYTYFISKHGIIAICSFNPVIFGGLKYLCISTDSCFVRFSINSSELTVFPASSCVYSGRCWRVMLVVFLA